MSLRESGRLQNVTLGVVAIVLTVFAMSFADAVIKYVSFGFPLWQIYVVRSLLVISALAAISLIGPKPFTVGPRAKGWAFLRGLLLALMYVAIYAAAPVLSLTVIAASLYTAPLFITLFSALLIGEPVGPRRWAAIVLGFLGVLVILRPGTDAFSPLALIPIVAAVLYALAAIITRSKCGEESPMLLGLALNFSLLALGAAATAAIALWHPTPSQASSYPFLLGYWVNMGPREWGITALLAALMVAISLGLAKAYQSAPPPIIATFDYSYMVFAAFWSFVIFSQLPDRPTILGMLMIAGAGMLVIERTTSRQDQPAISRSRKVAVFFVKGTRSESGGTSHFDAVLALSRLLELILAWNRRSRDWHLLAEMNERNLRDIGIDSSMFKRDSAVSYWRLRHGPELGPAADRRNAERRGRD